MRRRILTVALLLATLLVFSACSRSNNLLLGRVESHIDQHSVVVTDCYRFEVPAVESLAGSSADSPAWRFAPCRDAVVELNGNDLRVNGVDYGAIAPQDAITVDHGVVLINDQIKTKPRP